MSVRTACLEIASDHQLKDVETEAALARWREGDGCFWILLDADERAEADSWLRARDLGSRGLDTFLEPGRGAKFQLLDDAPAFQLPTLIQERPGEPTMTTFVCRDSLVIQIRDRPSDAAEAERDALAAWQGTELPEASTSGLICALLVLHSATLLTVAVGLGAEARRLSARVDDAPAGVALGEIMALKRQIRDLDEQVDDQLAILAAVKIVRRPGLDLERVADFFQVALTNSDTCDRAVDRLHREAGDIRSGFDTFQQSKLNRRLGLLTIVSAIFLPLTLIAGIYGMNFDVMPELHLRLGYPAVLLVMATGAAGLLWYFSTRGWFVDL